MLKNDHWIAYTAHDGLLRALLKACFSMTRARFGSVAQRAFRSSSPARYTYRLGRRTRFMEKFSASLRVTAGCGSRLAITLCG